MSALIPKICYYTLQWKHSDVNCHACLICSVICVCFWVGVVFCFSFFPGIGFPFTFNLWGWAHKKRRRKKRRTHCRVYNLWHWLADLYNLDFFIVILLITCYRNNIILHSFLMCSLFLCILDIHLSCIKKEKEDNYVVKS